MKKGVLYIVLFIIIGFLSLVIYSKTVETKNLKEIINQKEIIIEELSKNLNNLEEEKKDLNLKEESFNNLKTSYIFPNNSFLKIGDWEMNVSNQKVEDVYNQFLNTCDIYKKFILKINNIERSIDLSDAFFSSLTIDNFKNIILGISFEDYFNQEIFSFELKDTFEFDSLKTKTLVFNFLNNLEYEYTKATNASFNVKDCSFINEEKGTELDLNLVLESILNEINNNFFYLDLDNEKFYKNSEITVSDLKVLYEDYINIYNWKAEYSVTDYVIYMKDYMDYVTINDDLTCTIDTSFMKSAVLHLSKTVDKKGATRIFNSTLDGAIEVSGGTYGEIMNNAEEIIYLKEQLLDRKSVINREPIWKVEPKSEGFENTYIEVDISAQHVWYYENNELVMEADCVTGKANSNDTPFGYYFISEKVNGKYLTGPTWKSWVDKWMRITNQGHGLHDAQWRKNSEFGGDTYIEDGSHGCINLPKQFAYDLYDAIKVGTLVIIHE